MAVAILGGTGNLGYALARRWALSGLEVVIGSRTADKAEAAAAEICKSARRALTIRGTDNVAAAQSASIAVLTVPFSHQAAVLSDVKAALQGKILVDTTVPLVPPRVARVQLPTEGSAALIARNLLGSDVRVVSAFQNVAAELLRSDEKVDCDVLVCGDSKDAREQAVKLIEAAGMRGFHAGSLEHTTTRSKPRHCAATRITSAAIAWVSPRRSEAVSTLFSRCLAR